MGARNTQDVINVANLIKTNLKTVETLQCFVFRIGMTIKMFCTTKSFIHHFMAKGLKEMSNLKTIFLHIFLLQKKSVLNLLTFFCDDKWLSVVCYPADIFREINISNLSLQG